MADTTVKISAETRDRLQALATARGTSIRGLVDQLAAEAETQQLLGRATESFRAAIARPGFAEAFDRDFGGTPARTAPRAA
ncbi:antitoxin MazE7 [Streptomyces lydicus]|uniref:antitoxin MazE7 n=1 Tax=Streptomyces lydicus TaxID=47763 RepID=UPI0037AE7F24